MKLKLIFNKRWLIILFGIFWTITVQSQFPDILIKDALEKNPELKALENEYFAALEKAPQASQLPDPEAGIGAFPLPVETRLGPQVFRFSAVQMFPWFGTLEAKAKLENAKAKAVYERTAAKRLDLIYQVKKAYFQLYEIEERRAIIQQSIDLLESLERLAMARVESGKSSSADVLRVQLKTNELKQELEILETEVLKPLAELNSLLNRPLKTQIDFGEKLSFARLPFNRDTIKSIIEANHPTLRMLELQREVSQQAVVASELAGKPAFGIGMDYIMVNKRGDLDPSGNGRDILQLKAMLKIPIYRKKYEAKKREENFRVAALNHQKKDLTNKFMAVVEKAYADYESARLKMDLYEKQLVLIQSAINILQTDYSTKGGHFDELLKLEKELIDYDLKRLKAIVQSHLAKCSIERMIP